jgi:hypothetical protein
LLKRRGWLGFIGKRGVVGIEVWLRKEGWLGGKDSWKERWGWNRQMARKRARDGWEERAGWE